MIISIRRLWVAVKDWSTCRRQVVRCIWTAVGWVRVRCIPHHAGPDCSPECYVHVLSLAHVCRSTPLLGRPRELSSQPAVAECPGEVEMYHSQAGLLNDPRYTPCTCQSQKNHASSDIIHHAMMVQKIRPRPPFINSRLMVTKIRNSAVAEKV